MKSAAGAALLQSRFHLHCAEMKRDHEEVAENSVCQSLSVTTKQRRRCLALANCVLLQQLSSIRKPPLRSCTFRSCRASAALANDIPPGGAASRAGTALTAGSLALPSDASLQRTRTENWTETLHAVALIRLIAHLAGIGAASLACCLLRLEGGMIQEDWKSEGAENGRLTRAAYVSN